MRIPGPSTISDSIRYGFAVGKVRVLETRVFGRATFERLLDAGTFADQLRVLSDTYYGRYLEGARTATDVERGLEAALNGFYCFLEEAKLPPEVVRFFRIRHDYANLKAKLKAEALGEPLTGMLSALATTPPEAFEGGRDGLPPFLGQAYDGLSRPTEDRAGVRQRSTRDDLGRIDAEVDRRMFADLLRTGKESGSEFLVGLARLMIDVANVKAALRARARKLPSAEAAAMLVPGGALAVDRIMEAYAAPEGAIVDAALRSPMLSEVSSADLADPERLDVVGDDLVVRYLRRARMVPIGVEPVIAYVMAREAEVVALRVLLVGKLAGVPAEALRARLRDLYV